MKFWLRYRPYIFLLLALACFYAGNYFRTPLPLQHKMLVVTEKEQAAAFKDSIIFVVSHSRDGAFGLIVNKGDFGGPMFPDEAFTLHSIDVMLEGSEKLGDTGFAYVPGDFVRGLDKKPAWFRVMKGYAGWGGGQLDSEVRRGVWDVRDFDRSLVE